MDVFLKISVLQAKFCWLGDLDKIMSLETGKLLVSEVLAAVRYPSETF